MQLLKHFKELTVRPKNAQDLKGLILQLAIKGKLTSNWRKENPDIEPASELLKRIQKERDQLIKEKKIKKEKPLPPITVEEIPFNISNTWVWTRLGDIGTTNVGLTYKPAHINDDGVPVLRSSNIQEGELCLKDLVRVNTDFREKDIIKEGDLLICARNGSRRLVGKCTIIDQIDEVMVFGAFMAIFRSNYNPYLQLFIQSPQYRSKLDGVETTTINQITQGNLKETTVPLPPLEEQKAIVAIVEALFKEVEQLEQLTVERIALKEKFVASALSQLTTNNAKKEWDFLQQHFPAFFNETANIKKLRETVLQLAVQGKLTADWRANNSNVEDASILLKCIQEEKAQLIKDKKIRKEKTMTAVSTKDIDFSLPNSWVPCRMGDLFSISTGKGYKKAEYSDSGVRLFQIANVTFGKTSWDITVHLPESYIDANPTQILKKNDLVMALNRPLLGRRLKVAMLDVEDAPCIIYQRVGRFAFHQVNMSEWMLIYLQSPLFIDWLLDQVRGINIPFVNQTKLYQHITVLPPIKEQKAIVLKVNALMGLCDALEQQVQQSREQSEQLMQSCLREVFEG